MREYVRVHGWSSDSCVFEKTLLCSHLVLYVKLERDCIEGPQGHRDKWRADQEDLEQHSQRPLGTLKWVYLKLGAPSLSES